MLPSYKKTYKEYRLVKDAHQGVLSGSIYRVVLRCLHSDSRNSASGEKLRAPFETFQKLEAVLVVKDERLKADPPAAHAGKCDRDQEKNSRFM